MDETVSVVQDIERPAHKKEQIIAIPLIILLPLACLVLTDERSEVSPRNPCKSMGILGGLDDSIHFKGIPGTPTYAGAAKFSGEGR